MRREKGDHFNMSFTTSSRSMNFSMEKTKMNFLSHQLSCPPSLHDPSHSVKGERGREREDENEGREKWLRIDGWTREEENSTR